MQNSYDYKQFAVLYVDDEEKSLKAFARAFGDVFRIYTAPTAKEGLRILDAHRDEVGILMTDQRMPGEKGVWLLEHARQVQPRILRILVTAYTDMEAAIDAVNAGAIYKYVSKPWEPEQLEDTLKHGLEFFMVQRERDQLLSERASVLHNMMIADRIVSLGLLSAGLSHHVRNALVAVKTFLDLAPDKMTEEKSEASKLRNPEFWKEYYQNVQAEIEKINNMLTALGTASERGDLPLGDEVRLHEVIGEVVGHLGSALAARGIQIQLQISDSLPPLRVDKARFHLLFELLLRDEMVTLPAGSAVHLSAALRPSTLDGPGIEVLLRDDGPGLPEDTLNLLFDPFISRTDCPMEYGINLMTCYFIVHHHCGSIQARSEPGKGTTFTIHLPIEPRQPRPLQQSVEFVRRVLLNEQVWQELASGSKRQGSEPSAGQTEGGAHR